MREVKVKKQPLRNRIAEKIKAISDYFGFPDARCKVALLFPGIGQLLFKQIIKGFLFMLAFICGVVYMVLYGGKALVGFFTLGTVKGDAWLQIKGDNSVIMMLMGIFTFIVLVIMLSLYFASVKGAYENCKRRAAGKEILSFKNDLKLLINGKFYMSALLLPIIGVSVFNVLPIVFMILIAFTNYGGTVVPPELVDWIGFGNFFKLFTLGDVGSTFMKILGWNLIWAILTTAINYFGGLGIALLLNKKCVKGKVFWRAFPILAYAIPGFISMLAFKFLFSMGGPINQMIAANGGMKIGFLDIDALWSARIIGLGVNAWISIPTSMLLATGILSNMNTDLYEAAKLDGASPWKIFLKITLPFVIFATTPVLITQFTGNFNNFGIFYFLRGDMYTAGYFLASNTDLLINWLYNLSINNNYYAIGAAISLVIFIITSIISLIVYVMSPAYKKEDTFR